MGWNPEILTELRNLNIPLTLSVLPDSPFGLKIAQQAAKSKNFEVFLHIPLQPESSRNDTGISQSFITTDMNRKEIEEKFDYYFENFEPYISGVNHHMGSKFTTDQEKMEILLEKIKEKKLVYIDSLTAANSVGYKIAKKMNIPSGKRDIFIDNSADYEQIAMAIEKAAKLAETRTIIAIAHSRSTTVEVLKNKIPELKQQGYQFIFASKAIQ